MKQDTKKLNSVFLGEQCMKRTVFPKRLDFAPKKPIFSLQMSNLT